MLSGLEQSVSLLYGPTKRNILTNAEHNSCGVQSTTLSEFLMYSHDNDIFRDSDSSFVAEAARICRERYGCGTGTAVLLFTELCAKAKKLSAAGHHFKEIQNAISAVSELVLQSLARRAKVCSSEDIRKVVLTAFPSLGTDSADLVCSAISHAGPEGKVAVLRGNTADTFVNKISGIVINATVPKFIFTGRSVPVIFDRPDILVSSVPLAIEDITNILVYANKGGIPLVMLAPAFGAGFELTLEKNADKGALVCINCVPNVGQSERDEFFGDIASLTGARLVDNTFTSGNIDISVLGTADSADIYSAKLTIHKEPPERASRELEKVSEKMDKCRDRFEATVLRQRHNLLSAKTSEIVVGAFTQFEQDKKYFDFVNAVYAAKQAQKHGSIVGAGYDLYQAAVDAANAIAADPLARSVCACFAAPARAIAEDEIDQYNNGLLLDKVRNNLVEYSDSSILDSYEAIRGAVLVSAELAATYIGSERINNGDNHNGSRSITDSNSGSSSQ